MSTADRGRKHLCPECKTKYYDLKKAVVACPVCGAKPPVAKLPKALPSSGRSGRTTFGRFR